MCDAAPTNIGISQLQFNMFFPVFRGEIIARFRFRNFLSSLDFVVVT